MKSAEFQLDIVSTAVGAMATTPACIASDNGDIQDSLLLLCSSRL